MSNLHITNPGDLGVLVVGAGVAGLTLARRLSQNGEKVTVFEKSPGVGGRLATRRGEGWIWDHGLVDIQPSDVPPETYLDWQSLGILENRKDQPQLSWICSEGMTQLPKKLEVGFEVIRNCKIDLVRVGPGGKVWMIRDEEGNWHHGNKLVLAIPAPQAELILDGSFPQQMISLKESLLRIKYRPTLTVLGLINRGRFPELKLKTDRIVEICIDNGEKGIRNSLGALTLHLTADYSRKNFDKPDKVVLTEIKNWVKKKMGAEITGMVVKRWRFSQVTHSLEEPFLAAKLTSPLFVIGDGFCGGGIKGALLSANSLADHLLNCSQTKESGRNHAKKNIYSACPK